MIRPPASTRGWAIAEGVAGIAAGVITFVWPSITALALLFFIAVWAVVVGAVRLWIAIEARDVIPHAWLLGLLGVLSILFGVVLMITPGTGALVITWLIGWYAVLFAAMLFVVGWQQREIEHGIRTAIQAPCGRCKHETRVRFVTERPTPPRPDGGTTHACDV